MTKEPFHLEISRRRIAAGLTQQDLATAASIHRNTVSNVEAGKIVPLSAIKDAIRRALDAAEAIQ